MHCIILLPDAAGRLPTAEELRQRGFAVSRAASLPEPSLPESSLTTGGVLTGQAPAQGQALSLAAETSAPYGLQLRPER